MSLDARPWFPLLLSAALLACGGTGSAEAAAGEFVPMVEIAPDDPGIDDLVTVRLSIEVPADRLVNFPRLDGKLGAFVVVGQRALEPDADEAATREWRQEYHLEPEATGDLAIPPLIITVQDPKTPDSREVTTPPTAIHIASIVPEATELRAIRELLPPVPLPREGAAVTAWGLAVLAALAVAGLALWWWRRPAATGERTADDPAAGRRALDALAELGPQVALDQAGIERFHVRLAAVIRHYLQDGFNLAAPLRTTEELLREAAAAASPLNGSSAMIAKPLGQCDLVKFARHRPSDAAMRAVLEDAVAFVRATSARALGAGAPADGG